MESRRDFWPVVLILCAVSAISYVERTNIAVVGHLIRHDLELTKSQLGSVFSAFTLGYPLRQETMANDDRIRNVGISLRDMNSARSA